MNIAATEAAFATVAKIYGCKEKDNKKITYSFTDSYHRHLCIDKRDIILAELESCKGLLKYAVGCYSLYIHIQERIADHNTSSGQSVLLTRVQALV